MSVTGIDPSRSSAFDRPLPLVRRTAREVIALLVGIAFLVGELAHPNNDFFAINVSITVTGFVLFASRAFFARYVGIAGALGALACAVAFTRRPFSFSLADSWRSWGLLAFLILLTSRDLADRFDRAPTWLFGWWRNRLGELDDADLRLLRWSLYALTIPIALLYRAQFPVGAGTAVPALAILLASVGVGLLLGWMFLVLALPPLAIALVLQLIPTSLSGALVAPRTAADVLVAPGVWRPTMGIAIGALVLTTIAAVRYLRGGMRPTS